MSLRGITEVNDTESDGDQYLRKYLSIISKASSQGKHGKKILTMIEPEFAGKEVPTRG